MTAKEHLAKGEWEPAVAIYEQVISLMEEAEDVAGKAEGLNNIASVYLALEEWEKALDYAGQARALYQEIGDQAGEAVTMNNIAAAYDGMGNWAEAMSIYETALDIAPGDRRSGRGGKDPAESGGVECAAR